MKKRGLPIIFIFLTLILFSSIFVSSFVLAQTTPMPFQEEMDKIENYSRRAEELKEEDFDTTWDYLKERWEEHLLENRFFSESDTFLTRINPVFLVLFGINWNIGEIVLILGIIILWSLFVYLGYVVTHSFQNIELFKSKAIRISIGIIFAIITANFKIFENNNFFYWVVNGLGRLIFSREEAWARFLIFMVILVVIIIISYVGSATEKYLKRISEEKEKKELEHKVAKHEAHLQGQKEGLNLTK
jgi:Na+-transporting methylmalonyl-CoA/oxaloacetate decarboxylase gamma subunit